MNWIEFSGNVWQQGVSEALPVSFAALGETLSERAGVVNIGVEGLMLAGALAGVVGVSIAGAGSSGAAASGAAVVAGLTPFGGPTLAAYWIGLASGAAAGAAISLIFALVTVAAHCDQIVAGLGVNLLCLGVTGVTSQHWPAFASAAGEHPAALRTLRSWPVFGGIDLAGVLMLLTAAGIWLLLFRTMTGLGIQAVGEKPAAADTAGISVSRVRLACIAAGGALAGLGGAYLSVVVAGRFQEEMTAGRGFLALALVIFGRWSPIGVVAATLFFGCLIALQQNLQPLLSADQIHTLYPLLLMSPYVLTLAVLALTGSARAPAALGQAYKRG